MFEIINNYNKDIEELDILNNYIKFIIEKEKLENCVFNIILVDDNYIHKHYFLGVMKKDCVSQEKTTELINESISHFDKYIEMSKTADEARYLPIVYYMLYESYLELYYLDQANEKARTKQYFLQTNTNREKAKYYLQQAQSIKHTLDSDLVAKNLENDLSQSNGWLSKKAELSSKLRPAYALEICSLSTLFRKGQAI